MFSIFIFVQLKMNFDSNSFTENGTVKGQNNQICFYVDDKKKCPSNITHLFGPNDYYSDILLNTDKSIEIYVAETIKLNRSLLFSSPVSFYIYGKAIIGTIELGCQTCLHIINGINTSIKVNWSINTKQISKVYTQSKVKSVFISIINQEQINNVSSYDLLFYSGNKTKSILFTSDEIENKNEIHNEYNLSILNINNLHYVRLMKHSVKNKSIKYNNRLGDNIHYEEIIINSRTGIIIKGTGPMYNFTWSPLPPYPGFIEMEEGITTIGSYVFYKIRINEIEIPNSVFYIGKYAFSDCNLITHIDIPDSVLYIDSNAFDGCYFLEQITISRNLLYLGSYAFYVCSRLQSISFYEKLTEILPYTFANCYNLISIDLNKCNNLISIQTGAFYKCFSLVSIEIPNAVQDIGVGVFYGCYHLREVNIPTKLYEINNSTFAYCCKLNSIKLPEAITTIGISAFYHCCDLESIYIPKNVKSIGSNAFLYCLKLKCFIVDDNNEYYSTIDGILSSKDKSIIYICPPKINATFFEVPEYVTTIYQYSFCFCTNIKHITIPSSIDTLYIRTFDNCQKLESITILGNCLIGMENFNHCYDLLSIVYLGKIDSLYTNIMINEYNSLSVYVPDDYSNNSFCGYEVIKTNKINCRAIHHKCIECNDNSCINCDDGWKIEDKKCVRDCKSVLENCVECTSSGTCLKCEKGFVFENDQCVSTNICDYIIENCGICNKSLETFYCEHCFDGFTLSADGLSCIQDANVIEQNENDYVEIIQYYRIDEITSVINNFTYIDLSKIQPDISSQTISLELKKNHDNVLISQKDDVIKEFIIPAVKDKIFYLRALKGYFQNMIINCPKGSSISTISDTKNLTLKGSRTINIDFNVVEKVLLDEKYSEPLVLKSSNGKLSIDEIEVRYKQKITSESNCNTIIIHPSSELILEKVNVNTVKIGLLSSIDIRNEETVVSHFKVFPVFYNLNKAPIKFHQPFPKLKDIDIEFEEIDPIVQDEIQPKFIVAKFIGDNEDENKNICQSFQIINKNKYSIECKKDDYGPNYNLITTLNKENKVIIKKKILSGIIASYVIGGLVFLAIFSLSIYYISLSIKYKRCTNFDENSSDESQI